MITKTIINNFKNFNLLETSFERINIIKGKNGAGKTNLIEAIFISLNGHPFVKSLRPIQRDESKPAIITSIVDSNTILARFDNKGKVLKLNSKPVTIITLKRKFPCIDYSINTFMSFKSKDYMFSLIDRGIYAEETSILDKLVKYSKLQKLKRNILKEKLDQEALKVLNNQIKETIYNISRLREKFVNKIKNGVHNCFREFYNLDFKISYKITDPNRDIFEEEIKRKRILFSLKKDSLTMELNNRKIQFSSVGERKIALLCIVLSIVKMYNEKGKAPIFLIDDLEGDLDRETQEKTFEIIKSLPNQIFLTTLGVFKGYNTIDLGGLSQSG